MDDLMYKVAAMKFEDPADGEARSAIPFPYPGCYPSTPCRLFPPRYRSERPLGPASSAAHGVTSLSSWPSWLSQEVLQGRFKKLHEDISNAFRGLEEEYR